MAAEPFRAEGAIYCTLADGRRVCTGAMMGRGSDTLANLDPEAPLYLRRVPFVDGCYDPGGAYWGGPADLFCAWHDAFGEGGEPWTYYTRAPSREAAMAEIEAGAASLPLNWRRKWSPRYWTIFRLQDGVFVDTIRQEHASIARQIASIRQRIPEHFLEAIESDEFGNLTP